MRSTPFIIGLTGGIASGKTHVSELLRQKGAAVVDADEVSHALTVPGSPIVTRIAGEFKGVVDKNGVLDRGALANIVFADKEALKRLNSIIHPAIWRECSSLMIEHAKTNKILLLVAPLLFEQGADALVDQVWVVDVNTKTQIERLMQRDSLTLEQAEDRISSQLPNAEKIKRADVLVDNNGSLENTTKEVDKLWIEHVEPYL